MDAKNHSRGLLFSSLLPWVKTVSKIRMPSRFALRPSSRTARSQATDRGSRGVLHLLLLGGALLLEAGCGGETTVPLVIPPLASLTVSPDTAQVGINATQQFYAAALDSAGNPVIGVPFSWYSGNNAVFTVNGSGRATGRGEGSALLIVSAAGVSDSAWVTVAPATRGWFGQVSNAGAVQLNAVFFNADGRSGWAVGDLGKIIYTADAGGTWTPQASNTSFPLNGIWFSTVSEGWAVGAGGTVLRTVDGGGSWSRLTNVGASETLMDVHFVTPDSGWVVGAAGVILRTFDRGVSWQRLNPVPTNLNGVSFAGSRDGWAVGDGGAILGTHDSGQSWFVVQPAVTTQSLQAVWRRSESRAVAAGASGVTPRTVSGPDSTSWVLGNAGASNQIEGVHFPSDQTGYVAGSNGAGAVLRTNDGGSTWQLQTTNTLSQLRAIFFVDSQRGWAVGANGVVIHTVTGGLP
jgi:photosystem II stability/assembly factor-like uncharacterized protein